MDYENEMKERFVQMLKDRQIICVGYIQSSRADHWKVIGANNDGKWDFSAYINKWSGCFDSQSVVSNDIYDAIRFFLENRFARDGYFKKELTGYALHTWVCNHIATFLF